ncbi:cytochrome P450 [Multifurca ochricompacta]|uniref:Cytochrome P450 n=1 Tax=Multifurca ochricompacta TaxID=376703 RepID=A0AAD4QKF9_9AGAM|nr:cytochrome P450 [Multifurca ochricompacta]
MTGGLFIVFSPYGEVTVYDHPTVRSEQDPVVKLINEFGQRVGCAAYPGAHLVELFPWMRHIPSRFAKWKRDAETWYKKDSAMFEGLFNTVKSRIEEGDNRPSLTATLIRDVEGHKLSMREAAWSAGNLYNGGADTTAATMAWWTIAILAYPETQARAHAELDQVVGRARLPTFADYPRLPYIRAMVKEALRWRPVGPIGMPHQSVEDDWYEGMFIPKGAICIVNMWHLNRDPEVHGEDAAHFNPSRHLDGKGDVAPGPREAKEGHITYGFGRRACVARRVANNSLFIDIAMVLWASKIERKKDWSLDVDGCDDHGLVV